MIGELSIWLMVVATDPNTNKTYLIEDKQEPGIAECMFDQMAWLQKGLKVKRGDWVLSVRCNLEHEEGQPASFKPPAVKKEEGQALVPSMRSKDSSDQTPSEEWEDIRP